MYSLYEVLLGFGQIAVYIGSLPVYLLVLSIELLRTTICCCGRTRRANPTSVLITGGGSGIGRALARGYVRRGTRYVALCDINEAQLAEVKAELETLGAADVRVAKIDVRDEAAMQSFIYSFDDAHPLDVVHANAGVAESSAALDADPSKAFAGEICLSLIAASYGQSASGERSPALSRAPVTRCCVHSSFHSNIRRMVHCAARLSCFPVSSTCCSRCCSPCCSRCCSPCRP